MANYVTIDDIDINKIVVDKVEAKEIPDVGGKYFDVHIKYEYQNGAKRSLDLELPVVSTYGIAMKENTKTDKEGKPYKEQKYSCMFKFDPKIPEQAKTIDVINSIYAKTRELLGTVKAQTGGLLRLFKEKEPECDKYKHILYRPINKDTGELVENGEPNIWVKLYNYQTKKSMFLDLEEKEIEWPLLDKVMMSTCPLLRFQKIYVGTQGVHLQWFIDSAIVTSIEQRGNQNKQIETVHKINSQHKDLKDNLSKQLSELREIKREMTSLASTTNVNTTSKIDLNTGEMTNFENIGDGENNESSFNNFIKNHGPSITTPISTVPKIPKIPKIMSNLPVEQFN